MKSLGLISTVFSLLARAPMMSPIEFGTEAFLKRRNARVFLFDRDGISFHAMPVTTDCDIRAFGYVLHLNLALKGRMLWVNLSDGDGNQPIASRGVPIDASNRSILLPFDGMQMRLDFDQEQLARVI